jgi:hypothetical protein
MYLTPIPDAVIKAIYFFTSIHLNYVESIFQKIGMKVRNGLTWTRKDSVAFVCEHSKDSTALS